MEVDQEEQEEPHSWVEQEEPYSCGACGKRVTSNRINRARWYAYNHPSGWLEYGQICGPCLRFSWRSMMRSWDPNIVSCWYWHWYWYWYVLMLALVQALQLLRGSGIVTGAGHSWWWSWWR